MHSEHLFKYRSVLEFHQVVKRIGIFESHFCQGKTDKFVLSEGTFSIAFSGMHLLRPKG